MNVRHLTIALIALALLLVGCSPGLPDSPSLEGTQWVLVALHGETPLAGTAPTAEFSADQISGSTGCNTYFASYTVSGSDLSISDVASTEMYCMDPEGVMDQEQEFLTALASLASYRLTEARLGLLDGSGSVVLAFEPPSAVSEAPTPVPPTPTSEPTEAPPRPAFEPPAGFVQYQDSATGISVYLPGSWVVTGIIPGEFAILQSYPEDKYVGGEAREPGDTKCDLTIRPPDISVSDAIQGLRSSTLATIVSEQEIVLQSGEPATRMEVESLGPSISFYTEVNERTVVLTCWGEFAPVDEIAGTLGATE